MMTKEQHITYWVNSAQYDWEGAENDMYKVCTKDYTAIQLEKAKEVRQCLLKMLQSE